MNRPSLHHPRNAKRHGDNRRASRAAILDSLRALYGDKRSARIPDDWRDRLPEPSTYFDQHVAKLSQPKDNGYAVGLCPFHDDHSPSFGVNLTDRRGAWICYAGCGKGDHAGVSPAAHWPRL